MSTRSSLLERFAPRVQIQDADRVADGSAERLRLRPLSGARLDAPEAARLLVRRHLPIRTAHAALSEMADSGEAFVTVPRVEDIATLKTELAAVGVAAGRHAPAPLDVRLVRAGTKLSQSAFALRFGLDEATLRNWEQGRSEPGLAALTLLWTIHRNPDAVMASLDMEDDETRGAALPAS